MLGHMLTWIVSVSADGCANVDRQLAVDTDKEMLTSTGWAASDALDEAVSRVGTTYLWS